MPLNANALITTDYAERFLARTGGQGADQDEADDDTFLIDLINGYSSAIEDYTERQFVPESGTVTKVFAYTGTPYVSLAPYEARTVSAINHVTVGTAPVTTPLTLDDYVLEPRQRTKEGTYLWLYVGRRSSSYAWAAPSVSVTGEWGMATIPEPVKVACASEVKRAYDFSGAAPSPDFAGVEFQFSFNLSPDARFLLQPYRRRTL
jgi:hypothetical protein